MIQQVLSLGFFVRVCGAALGLLVLYFLMRRFYSQSKEMNTHANSFRIPTSNTLTVLGFLLPVLSAIAAYLYTKDPFSDYTWLLASITVFGVTLITAIWLTFSMFRVTSGEDQVKLKIPEDLHFVGSMVVMYGSLVIGIVYLAIFLLGLTPPKSNAKGGAIQGLVKYLEKPHLPIGVSSAEIRKVWGEPVSEDTGRRVLEYRTANSSIIFLHDEHGNVQEINEKRK